MPLGEEDGSNERRKGIEKNQKDKLVVDRKEIEKRAG